MSTNKVWDHAVAEMTEQMRVELGKDAGQREPNAAALSALLFMGLGPAGMEAVMARILPVYRGTLDVAATVAATALGQTEGTYQIMEVGMPKASSAFARVTLQCDKEASREAGRLFKRRVYLVPVPEPPRGPPVADPQESLLPKRSYLPDDA